MSDTAADLEARLGRFVEHHVLERGDGVASRRDTGREAGDREGSRRVPESVDASAAAVEVWRTGDAVPDAERGLDVRVERDRRG